MYVCMYVCVCVCMCVRVQVSTITFIGEFLELKMHIDAIDTKRTCVYVCIYVCMYVYILVEIFELKVNIDAIDHAYKPYIHTGIHTHTHTLP